MQKSYLSRKENIVLTAIEIVDELGLGGLTIKEIAQRQEVSEAAIYRHFSGKQDILLALVERFAQFDGMIGKTVLDDDMPALEGIRFVIRSFGQYYQNYSEIASFNFTQNIFRDDPAVFARMNDILHDRHLLFNTLLKKGQREGVLRSDMDTAAVADILLCLVYSLTYRWKTAHGDFELLDRISATLEMFLPSLMSQSQAVPLVQG